MTNSKSIADKSKNLRRIQMNLLIGFKLNTLIYEICSWENHVPSGMLIDKALVPGTKNELRLNEPIKFC